ncbi:Serine-threonine/tyrosine-protein kinase, catalytic domain [Dillenia turbinata]|uniref:Serine-threonine/tyrosine-protein kinase, catalytic domain n=1 Tax=Dillenia turbinata TaxID=194707 RepID=A0AAN8W5F0_9MAGN
MENSQALVFYITICVVAFIISKIIIAVLLYKRWKRKNMIYNDSVSGGKMVLFRSPAVQALESKSFLKKTMKLSNKDIIGSGGYGTVYKLNINESMSFAVKRLNRGGIERDRGFERELEAMGDIKHRNIVTLHGYYTSPQYNLLIYELMPNGSLDSYLHEYFDTGRATVKGDVYSFGVVLLELLTGKRPTDEAFIEEGTKLVTWVKTVVHEKKEEHALDRNLESCPVDEVNNVFSIALTCLQPEPSDRPTMAEVVKMLEQIKVDKLVTSS